MEEETKDEQTQPGQYLAYEREKKGLTVEDVAGKLYLSPHIVRALEEDAYDDLPEPVYVRGYIRSYCKLLSIDSEPVLEMYTENLPREEDNLIEDLSLDSPVNERRQRLIMFWGSVAVATIFLVLLLSWWQENQPVDSNVSKPLVSQDEPAEQSSPKDLDISDVPTEPEPEPVPPESEPPPLISQDEVEPADQPSTEDIDVFDAPAEQELAPPEPEPSTLMSQDEVKPVEQPNTEDLDIPNVPAEQEPAPQELESPPILDPIELKIEKAEDEDLYEEPTENPDSATLDNTDDTINIEFNNQQQDEIDNASQRVTLVVTSSGDSWARVRDGGGEIFIHRILPADYNKIFMVNLPLKFELGNAHNVSIMVDGKDYDFSSHIKPSRTAAFEVTKLP